MKNLIGSWAFLIGVVLAIVLGALSQVNGLIAVVLVILGLVVGFLNVQGKEIQPFITAGTVLVIVAALGHNVLSIIPSLGRILSAILLIFVPATMIVALKSVFTIAKR